MMPIERARAAPGGNLLALGLMLVIAWGYLLSGGGLGMSAVKMSSIALPLPARAAQPPASWSAGQALAMALMWWTMMIAMMLPGLALRAVTARRWSRVTPGVVLGYCLGWLPFSLVATAAHAALDHLALMDAMMMWSVSRPLSAGLLLAAALHLAGLAMRGGASHPEDRAADLAAGVRSGLRCTRRTGPVMLLLFVGGVMNLFWIIALSAWATVDHARLQGRMINGLGGLLCAVLAARVWLAG